jgi:hypothetical protein
MQLSMSEAMMSRIPAKVATIISNSLLALNVGSDRGVADDDKVYVMRTINVEDPDTHEKLGSVAVSVLSLRVTHVQPKLCTAVVTSTQDDDGNISPLRVRRAKKIADSSFEEKAGISVYVQVGDRVEIEIKDTYSDEPPF